MSKIWDALKKAELEREPEAAEAVEDLEVGGEGGTRILTGRQRTALQALLTHASLSEACEACGVGERTMQRWLKTPGFAAAYRAATRAALGDAIAQLKASSRQATEVLRASLTDPVSLVRVRAAEAIVNATSQLEIAAALAQAIRSDRLPKK